MAAYTLKNSLITDKAELRIGDKIYRVNDSQKNVKRFSKAADSDAENAEFLMLKTALGEKAANEIDEMDLPYPAHREMMILVTALMTGEKPDDIRARFHTAEQSE